MAGSESHELLDVIEDAVPYDGPHSQVKVCDAASGVSQLVRYMNNATQPVNAGVTLEYAADVYRVLAGVGGALYGLDQLFRQLRQATAGHAIDPTLYDDRRDRPGHRTAQELMGELAEAWRGLADAAYKVDAARELACHLGQDSVAQ